MPPRFFALALAVGAAAAGCTLQLDGAIACGDGFVDLAAGEECDPLDASSYVDACAGTSRPLGLGACDSSSCTLINDREQCSICGDGIIDVELGEECDGDELGGRGCPSGEGQAQCSNECQLDFSACNPCGNDVTEVELGEECEPGDPDDISGGVRRPCAGDASQGIEPLRSPRAIPYSDGEATACNDECQYVRLGCNYCNNDDLNEAIPIDDDANLSVAEWCDGDNFDDDRLREEFGSLCFNIEGVDARPNVACDDNCLGFTERQGEDACCLKVGERCPNTGGGLRCCYEFAHPAEPACEFRDVAPGMPTVEICR